MKSHFTAMTRYIALDSVSVCVCMMAVRIDDSIERQTQWSGVAAEAYNTSHINIMLFMSLVLNRAARPFWMRYVKITTRRTERKVTK